MAAENPSPPPPSLPLPLSEPELLDSPEGSPPPPTPTWDAMETWILSELKRPDRDAASLLQLQGFLTQIREARQAASRTDLERELIEKLKLTLTKKAAERKSRENLHALARYYLFLDEPDRAIRYLQQGGPASSEDPYYPLLLAYTYLRLGDYAAAMGWLEKVDLLLSTRQPLRLSPPIFAETISGFRLYTPRPARPFRPGEDVLIYLEVTGVMFKPKTASEVFCDLLFDLAIKDAMMNECWAAPDYGAYQQIFRGPIRTLDLKIALRIPNPLPSGRYRLILTCRDRLGLREATSEASLEVKDSQERPLSRSIPSSPPASRSDSTEASEPAVDRETHLKEKALQFFQEAAQEQAQELLETKP